MNSDKPHSSCLINPVDEVVKHSWQSSTQPSHMVELLEEWQGPVTAIIRCSCCQQPAYIRLLAWSGSRLQYRAFSLALLEPEAVSVFLRNIKNGSCDLQRKQQEGFALVNSAKLDSIVAFLIPEMTSLLDRSAPESRIGYQAWQQLIPDDSNNPFYLFLKQAIESQ